MYCTLLSYKNPLLPVLTYRPGESVTYWDGIVYMMAGSDTEYSSHRIAEAGVILRTLTPPTLATLDSLINHDTYIQSEIADIIGCRRPTVSRYLQSLEFEDIPISLTRKQGKHYKATELGERIFGLIDSMLDRLGPDLREIKWSDDDEQERIENKLSPLCDSRSIGPFLILEAMRSRVNLFDTSTSVNIKDIVIDVRASQQEMSESMTPKQIREAVWRFDNKTAVEFDGSQITLSKKGHEHARLLHQLAQILEDERDEDMDKSTAASSSERGFGGITHQLDPRPFRGGSQTIDTSRRTDRMASEALQEPPTIVPAYYLVSSDDAETGERQGSESPMLPFTSLTVSELANHANQLEQNYDDETLLEPCWALRTEDGLTPLGPAQLTLGTLSERE